jgi:hypothetical protein
MEERAVPGVVFEPIDGPMKLGSKAQLQWTVRVDRGPLSDILEKNVLQPMQLSVSGFTNAVPTEAGIVPGPCGIRGRMARLLERRSGALISDVAIRKAHEIAGGNDAVAKLRMADQVAAHLRLLSEPEPPAGLKPWEGDLRAILGKLAVDSSAPVRAWARYQSARVHLEKQVPVAEGLAVDGMWYEKVLAAVCVQDEAEGDRSKVLKSLEADSDATVRHLASSLAALPVRPQTNPSR